MFEQAQARGRTANGPRGGDGKAVLYARLARLKRGALVAALAGFAALAGLSAEHKVGSAATGAAGAQPSAPAAQQAPSNGYFDQSGSDSQGGYGFDQSPAQQAPITGSGAS
jgi:hypothetical protein